MLTLFSIPKAFVGHVGIIQMNAIRSWTCLPGCEVILFGEEEGLPDAARELGVRHIPDIKRNECGTPLVSDAFDQIRRLAAAPYVAYVNSDIIFDDTLLAAVRTMQASLLPNWLMVGERHDLDVTQLLDFSDGWQDSLRENVARHGALHGKAGIDYFVFGRDYPIRMPTFAVGRPGWDSWLIYKTRAEGIPLIDASNSVMAVHQNHPPAYRPFGAEALVNTRSAGGYYRMGTLRDADWRMLHGSGGLLELVPRLLGKLLFMPPVRILLAAKRFIQEFWALRSSRQH